jgi:uncharacterized protein (DUF2267 family)
MPNTPHTPLDTTIEKTNLVLKDIEEVYGWPKERRNQSYAALRAVLHALRDRLTIDESAQFAAQLPMLIRGLYFEGWDPSDVPQKPNREEFLQRIRRDFRFVDVHGGMELLVQTVLGALRRYLTDGEWEDIRTNMPKDLATVLP